MASALDPRFKLKYVDEDLRESIVDQLKVEMKNLMAVTVIIMMMMIITD